MKSKPYSVLLLYPDYLANNYGEETYYTYVRASAPAEAVTAAQKEVADVNGAEDSAADFLPLLCIEGHHEPLPVGSWPLPKTRKRQMNIEACVIPAPDETRYDRLHIEVGEGVARVTAMLKGMPVASMRECPIHGGGDLSAGATVHLDLFGLDGLISGRSNP